jgi:hypothetical protein
MHRGAACTRSRPLGPPAPCQSGLRECSAASGWTSRAADAARRARSLENRPRTNARRPGIRQGERLGSSGSCRHGASRCSGGAEAKRLRRRAACRGPVLLVLLLHAAIPAPAASRRRRRQTTSISLLSRCAAAAGAVPCSELACRSAAAVRPQRSRSCVDSRLQESFSSFGAAQSAPAASHQGQRRHEPASKEADASLLRSAEPPCTGRRSSASGTSAPLCSRSPPPARHLARNRRRSIQRWGA